MIKKEHSCGGVVVNNGRVVVVFQHKSNSWSLPKGHVEDGESLEETAKREIYEETGLTDLKFVKKLGSFVRGINGEYREVEKTITLFLFTTNQERLAPQDSDNPEARWVPIAEVADLLPPPKDKEFFQSIQDQLFFY